MDEVDAVVVGSGFGGSVAAARLAAAGRSVVLLERGKAYPPGSFPRSPREMSRNFWDPSKGLHGMFDLWSFSDIDSVVSAGLGGGSLIYANVMIRKDEHWFVQEDPRSGRGYEYWPVNREQLDPDYDRAEAMLGATPFPTAFAPFATTPKTLAMQSAAAALVAAGRTDLSWTVPNVAVHFGGTESPSPGATIPGESLHGPGAHRRACRLCGECDIGCNDGAKNSLDFNYLTFAATHGADIRVRHDVSELERHPAGGYVVRYRDLTDHEGANGRDAPRGELRCKVLVVSAGSLGSTYLMMANARRLGGLPPALGTKFCGNGDLLGFIRTRGGSTLDGSRGPVITSTMRVGDELDPGDAATGRGFYLQDGGYPGFADWILETSTLSNPLWRSVKLGATLLANRIRRRRTTHLSLAVSQLVGSSSLSSGSLPVLGMGRDVPDGVMHLDGDWLEVDWNMESSRAYFARVKDLMEQVAEQLDGKLVVNPTWWLKRVVTVHPLGGCPMGTHAELPPAGTPGAPGVVDDHGEVFGHPGLFVADGAVMPGPVGPNPSLTIAALAERFSTRMIERAS